ncbi:3-oxoacyl-[acyl-carrier protein] reductase [Chryseobacterium sp. RU37D]|uniref:SDR family NAD(P)-dependent oxidoreductase n=1 Tax=Chryseobacterium sp. RU37D TaxID=1907397 RepID=UPI00095445DB|nr:SDR family oxidoreductase [Chryseobacterium sp. RU37D]SIQ05032.1 3-oxoacyl-[acyl-carrier protein] reductase [Chryseobacterium sp. RU37D]
MKNKTIFITGNRKGIGLHLTKYYLEKGYNVLGCSRAESDLSNENYRHYICDVSDEKEVKHVVRQAKKEFDGIDILINNAGLASLNHSLLTPGSTVKKLFETNFYGSFFFAKECAKVMKNNGGRIVNFSTVAVPLNLEGEMIYASSKAAVEKMTKILAKELADFNITVNAIGPSPIYTDLIKVVPKDKIEELLNQQAIHRLGELEDVENVIDFFISPKSSFVTGQIIYLGGL